VLVLPQLGRRFRKLLRRINAIRLNRGQNLINPCVRARKIQVCHAATLEPDLHGLDSSESRENADNSLMQSTAASTPKCA